MIAVAVKITQRTIRKPAPDMTGIPATPWATARLNGFIQEEPKPICVATYEHMIPTTAS